MTGCAYIYSPQTPTEICIAGRPPPPPLAGRYQRLPQNPSGASPPFNGVRDAHGAGVPCPDTAPEGGMDHPVLLLADAAANPPDHGPAGRARSPAAPAHRQPPRRVVARGAGHRRRHAGAEPRHRRPPHAALRALVQDIREAVRVLVRQRAAPVPDGRGADQRVPVVQVRGERHRQVVAAAPGHPALHRPRAPHGQRRALVAPAPRRRAGVHARQAEGARGSHGGVHEADDPCAPGGSVVAGAVARRRAASGGGDRRVHDSAHRRHHLAHRVRHELRYREAHLPSPRGPAAPHGELQPPPLDPRQPVLPEQVQEGDHAAERRAGGRADGVHRAEQGDRRRGPHDVGLRPGPAGHAAGRDGEEEEAGRSGGGGAAAVQLRPAAGDRRVQDVLLRGARHVGAAAHLGADAARHAPGVAGQGPRRGRPSLRRRPAVVRRPLQAHRAADDHPRDAAAVPAGDAAATDGVRGHPPHRRRRPPPAARPVGVDPGAGHPPRRVHLGPRRARVQAGAVRGGAAPGVPAVRVGPAQLRRPGVRARRGQGRARHAAVPLSHRHLRRLPPRAGERAHPPPQARRARPPPPAAAVTDDDKTEDTPPPLSSQDLFCSFWCPRPAVRAFSAAESASSFVLSCWFFFPVAPLTCETGMSAAVDQGSRHDAIT